MKRVAAKMIAEMAANLIAVGDAIRWWLAWFSAWVGRAFDVPLTEGEVILVFIGAALCVALILRIVLYP